MYLHPEPPLQKAQLHLSTSFFSLLVNRLLLVGAAVSECDAASLRAR